jgi:hypothetical protein
VLFYFRQKSRLSIASDQKIKLAFFLVTKIAEFKLSQAHIIPAFDGLEQVAGDKRFSFVSRIFY